MHCRRTLSQRKEPHSASTLQARPTNSTGPASGSGGGRIGRGQAASASKAPMAHVNRSKAARLLAEASGLGNPGLSALRRDRGDAPPVAAQRDPAAAHDAVARAAARALDAATARRFVDVDDGVTFSAAAVRRAVGVFVAGRVAGSRRHVRREVGDAAPGSKQRSGNSQDCQQSPSPHGLLSNGRRPAVHAAEERQRPGSGSGSRSGSNRRRFMPPRNPITMGSPIPRPGGRTRSAVHAAEELNHDGFTHPPPGRASPISGSCRRGTRRCSCSSGCA